MVKRWQIGPRAKVCIVMEVLESHGWAYDVQGHLTQIHVCLLRAAFRQISPIGGRFYQRNNRMHLIINYRHGIDDDSVTCQYWRYLDDYWYANSRRDHQKGRSCRDEGHRCTTHHWPLVRRDRERVDWGFGACHHGEKPSPGMAMVSHMLQILLFSWRAGTNVAQFNCFVFSAFPSWTEAKWTWTTLRFAQWLGAARPVPHHWWTSC